jgi:hypothetical protein
VATRVVLSSIELARISWLEPLEFTVIAPLFLVFYSSNHVLYLGSFDLFGRSIRWWWWYINEHITIVNIIHRPAYYLEHDILETGFCFHLQVGPIHRASDSSRHQQHQEVWWSQHDTNRWRPLRLPIPWGSTHTHTHTHTNTHSGLICSDVKNTGRHTVHVYTP